MQLVLLAVFFLIRVRCIRMLLSWILRYLKEIINHYIYFGGTNNSVLEAYTDADWAGDIDSRKSTSGYLIHFGNGWETKG
jgi:hypothetical protein